MQGNFLLFVCIMVILIFDQFFLSFYQLIDSCVVTLQNNFICERVQRMTLCKYQVSHLKMNESGESTINVYNNLNKKRYYKTMLYT